jgi:hypothetical protein
MRNLFKNGLAIIVAVAIALCFFLRPTRGDGYDNEKIECSYITQCSMSSANSSVGAISNASPGYGVLNDWRIGNGKADSVDCGAQAIGAIGLLYGYSRLSGAARSNGALDARAKTALSAFFWNWVRNSGNQIKVNSDIAFSVSASYDASGAILAKGGASPAATAAIISLKNTILLIAWRTPLSQISEAGLSTVRMPWRPIPDFRTGRAPWETRRHRNGLQTKRQLFPGGLFALKIRAHGMTITTISMAAARAFTITAMWIKRVFLRMSSMPALLEKLTRREWLSGGIVARYLAAII